MNSEIIMDDSRNGCFEVLTMYGYGSREGRKTVSDRDVRKSRVYGRRPAASAVSRDRVREPSDVVPFCRSRWRS
jgi:hypothetical protein